jgi:hypothetical protein
MAQWSSDEIRASGLWIVRTAAVRPGTIGRREPAVAGPGDPCDGARAAADKQPPPSESRNDLAPCVEPAGNPRLPHVPLLSAGIVDPNVDGRSHATAGRRRASASARRLQSDGPVPLRGRFERRCARPDNRGGRARAREERCCRRCGPARWCGQARFQSPRRAGHLVDHQHFVPNGDGGRRVAGFL